MIPSYKSNYKSSVGVLYRPLQDIEIYVEDHDSEVFYNELFSRLLSKTVRIKKIIPLGCRTEIIKAVKTYDYSYPRIFISDADLYWVSNTFQNTYDRLFQYEFYCIENVLFCQQAAATIIQESIGNISFDDALKRLDWDKWLEEITQPLIELFIIFAVSFKLSPSIKTTNRKFQSIITQKKGKPVKVDIEKINEIKNEIVVKLIEEHGIETVNENIETVSSHASKHGINIVSGKDFLLPAFNFRIKELCNCDMKTESRNFRLARHCNLEMLFPLRDFIVQSIRVSSN